MTRRFSMATKPERTVPLHLEVRATQRVSEHYVRVTLGGGEIGGFEYRGFDQWFRLYIPPTAADALVLPHRDGMSGYAELLLTNRAVRPTMRNYSVRAYRAATADRDAEIDVDFVLHESASGEVEGVAAAWALRARPGDAVGLQDEGYGYQASPEVRWHLLVADDTALPAVAGICATLPADATGIAVIEIPDAADRQDFPHPAGVEVRWTPRSPEGHERIGAAAYAAAIEASAEAPAGVARHAYAIGEQGLATGIRRHLVNDRGWDKTEVSFCGYWRLPKGAAPIEVLVDRALAA